MWAVLRKIMFLHRGLYAYPPKERESGPKASRVEIRTKTTHVVMPLERDPW